MSELLRQYKAFLKTLEENPYDEVTHRTFADWLEENGEDDEALEHREWTQEKQEAKDYLANLAPKVGMTYKKLLRDGNKIAAGEYCFPCTYGPQVMRDEYDKFLQHWKTLTGSTVGLTSEETTSFRCEC